MIAFCTTCKGRVQHVEQTLLKNMRDNTRDNCTFIVLDYNSRDGLDRYLKGFCNEIQSGKLAVYSFPTANKFHMAHAKNMAHRCGMLEGANVLCNLDADNFAGEGAADYIEGQIGSPSRCFLWSEMVKDGEGRLPKGISGRIAVTTDAFVKVGGYDEKYATWSPDDKDFQTRLCRLGYYAQKMDNRFLKAILHNDRLRFREYPEAKSQVTEDGFHSDIYESENTIANFGNFGCGTVYRNFDFDHPIELKPLPTRIFGIGLHKTATTSLHKALQILGYDSAHWENAHWAKAIWDEMKSSGRSLTLEKHYALSDLPISILYKELDKAYPGSKFILTIRDEADWLRSVRDHWDSDKNPFRAAWATDPFTHRIHKELYGQKGFDADVFLKRYRRHNAEVQEYFGNRSDDLLIMQQHRLGWIELCKFLNKPVPDQSYPKAFVTNSQGKAE